MSKARDLADLAKNANDRLDDVATSDGALSNRNILINGNLAVNQRGLSIASVSTGAYGEDRWKKTAGGMTQIIEAANYLPNTVYTLSGTNVTTQQITSPASGDWTLPDIPVTARLIQLELGDTATPFEHRSYGDELLKCQRYYQEASGNFPVVQYQANFRALVMRLPVDMRATPSMGYDPTSSAVGAGWPAGNSNSSNRLFAWVQIGYAITSTYYVVDLTLDAEL